MKLRAQIGICLVFQILRITETRAPPLVRLSITASEHKCSRYNALYSNIDTDLARWKDQGISLQLMERTIEAHTTRKKDQKGFAAGFWKGKAYLIDEPNLRIAGHHAMLFFVYMRMLLHLEQTFTMPDVVRLMSSIHLASLP